MSFLVPDSQFDPDPRPPRRSRVHVLVAVALLSGVALGCLAMRAGLTGSAASVERQPTPRGPLSEEEQATNRLFREVAPSVVNINTFGLVRRRWSNQVLEVPEGSGSGVVWDASGIILTNFHVIAGTGGGGRVSVVLADGSEHAAKVIGYAPHRDLAVLRLTDPPAGLKPIAIGAAEEVVVGQKVFAIGNPFGLDHSLSMGIVSAIGRELQTPQGYSLRDLIQSDTAINPGNSGGPLLDSAGRMIGINTAIKSPSGASAGIGLSIPVDAEFRRIVPRLIEDGRLRRVGLGLVVAPDLWSIDVASKLDTRGVLISEVQAGTAAARAGLQGMKFTDEGRIERLGDFILGINGTAVGSRAELTRVLEGYRAGETVKVIVIRDGQRLEVPVVLQEIEG